MDVDDRRFKKLWAWRLRHHRDQWERIDETLNNGKKKTAREYRDLVRKMDMYPKCKKKVRGTRLANLVARAEEGPWLGVEADLTVVGPPLFNLLSDSERAMVDAPRDELDTYTGLMLGLGASTAVGLVSLIYLLGAGEESAALAFLACVSTVSAIGSVGFHRKSLDAANSYKEGIDNTFLLYRHRLLEFLDLNPPERVRDEPALFRQAAKLIQSNSERLGLNTEDERAVNTPIEEIEFRSDR